MRTQPETFNVAAQRRRDKGTEQGACITSERC